MSTWHEVRNFASQKFPLTPGKFYSAHGAFRGSK